MNLRNLAIWGVIIVVLIGLYSMITGGGSKSLSASEISYSQLLSKVSSGQIKTAEFHGPQVTVTDNANKPYTATTPNDQDDLTKRLVAQGANISFNITFDFGGMPFTLAYKGVVSADTIKFTGDAGGMPFELTVKKDKG